MNRLSHWSRVEYLRRLWPLHVQLVSVAASIACRRGAISRVIDTVLLTLTKRKRLYRVDRVLVTSFEDRRSPTVATDCFGGRIRWEEDQLGCRQRCRDGKKV